MIKHDDGMEKIEGTGNKAIDAAIDALAALIRFEGQAGRYSFFHWQFFGRDSDQGMFTQVCGCSCPKCTAAVMATASKIAQQSVADAAQRSPGAAKVRH